jgi:hypothetical protein
MQKRAPIAYFVHRENITRYQRLPQTALEPDRRRAVLDLLAQEEAAEREIDIANDGVAHAADALRKFLSALGVDPQRLKSDDPALMRSLQRICTSCGHKAQCQHEVAAGTAAIRYHNYCPNAMSLDTLFDSK